MQRMQDNTRIIRNIFIICIFPKMSRLCEQQLPTSGPPKTIPSGIGLKLNGDNRFT